MSGHPQQLQDERQRRLGGGRRGSGAESQGGGRGGGRQQVYLHAVTEVQAEILDGSGNRKPLEEVMKKSGADVQLDTTSPAAGMRTVVIRGTPSQIEAAVNLINQEIGAKESISEQAQAFWLLWVEAAFPDLDSRAYFLPPYHFNRVPMSRQLVAGKEVMVLHEALGQAVQSTPGQAGHSTPGQAVQSTPGQAGHSRPGQTGYSTPEQTGQSTPEQPNQSTPEQPNQSTPGQADQSTPGQAGHSTPGQAGQSTPGQPNQSTPGQTGQSTPGQAGQSNKTETISSTPEQRFSSYASVQDSDIRDDAAMQRVLVCLQKMSEQQKEVLVALSQLQFGQYLHEPCYAAAAAQLPVARSLPNASSRDRQGDFDVLLIHRQYGFVVCEVKAFGDCVQTLNMPQEKVLHNITMKLKDAMLSLNKAAAMLSHLACDIAAGVRITKTIAVPNLTARQVQEALSVGDNMLTEDLCRCLGTPDPADITGLCLCSDQLSDPKTPWDVSSDVLRELGNWWQRRVAVPWPDSHMTSDLYKTLVARFCGPATTVTVPCTSPPRLCVKTLGQAVSWTGECYTAQITLFPEQVDLINTAPLRLFLAGPPGTGKTVVLLLMGMEWLRSCNDVYIVSTWVGSVAACIMLHYFLQQILTSDLASVLSPGQPHLLKYDFNEKTDVEKAVNDLTQASRGGSVYIIADEALSGGNFQIFCDKLLTQVPSLHLWAANCYERHAPGSWQVEYLTRPLRSPPAVVREVAKDEFITKLGRVPAYSERGVADHTDGPPVMGMYHRGEGHSENQQIVECVRCGQEVGRFLHSLRVGEHKETTSVTSPHSRPPTLQWRDMLVLCWVAVTRISGVVRGLRKENIPVLVIEDHRDIRDIEDVATARTDVVWVGQSDHVRGLERKVVVCLEPIGSGNARVHLMSRCTSQLVIVSDS